MRIIFNYVVKHQVVLVFSIIVLGFILFQIKEILLLLFICYILMSAFSTPAKWLTQKGFPRVFAIILIYLLLLISIATLVIPLIYLINSQTSLFISNFPQYTSKLTGLIGFQIDTKSLITGVFNNVGDNIFSFTKHAFSAILSILTLIIISFYLLLDEENIKSKVVDLVVDTRKALFKKTMNEVEEKLGAWVRGQLLLCFVIGFLTWIGLSLLGIDYALSLALIAGALEILPTLGPILSSIPAIIIAFNTSPSLAAFVAVLYMGVQLLENNLIVPKIMQSAVGLHPIVVIVAILVGGQFMGVVGSLLAIPFTLVLIVIFRNTFNK